ncbi:hypothetical protein DITRI_Ditri15bG0042900 [Diplodiscus trichospermus]
MSILRKLHIKSHYSQAIFKIFPTRFFVVASIPNPGPFDEPFPDEPTAAYYNEHVHKVGQNGNMVTVGYLLNRRV